MSVSNPERVVTKQDLANFYGEILPYLGGTANAGFTPVGTIISMMSNHAPANYLACDGATYNIADYPELANHFLNEFGSKNYFGGDGTTTFKVPDLKGEFLRGTGTNSHTDCGNGAAVGTHQNGTAIPQFLFFDDGSGTRRIYTYIDSSLTNPKLVSPSNVDKSLKAANANQQHVTMTDGGPLTDTVVRSAVRPTNTSVLFCIATKNIYLNPENDYSTDEKVIGTWVTGETIYQKTVMINAVPSSGNALWVQIEPTLDVVVDYSAIVYSDVWSSVVDSISTQDATSSSYFKVYVYNYKWTDNPGCAVLINNIATAGWDDKKAFITVKYTKKTS